LEAIATAEARLVAEAGRSSSAGVLDDTRGAADCVERGRVAADDLSATARGSGAEAQLVRANKTVTAAHAPASR
jgi:hypothetical protein